MGFFRHSAARWASSVNYKKLPSVCIVGAGPAGYYAAMHLSKHLEGANIDIIEKLPVPFGLVRYGVAPDHPEVKNVINQFTKVATKPNVQFYGNISLGKDVRLNQLRQHYDAVLLTYGAEEDKMLEIENENAKNIVAARNFVRWYNGHPSDENFQIDLSKETAAILGQGNVALDVARILLSPIDDLKKTDITEYALNSLAESKLKELFLVGRRGPLQTAFTIKELREQLKIKNCVTLWRMQDFKDVADSVPNLPRPRKRLTELMLKSLNESGSIETKNVSFKYFKPIFFRSPSKFLVDNEGQVSGVEMDCTKLEGDELEYQRCQATGEKEIINCGLIFRSIGYKSIKVDSDLSFSKAGYVVNDKGRVLDNSPGLGRLYVAGWLGTGPAGVILHTMGNAFQVAKNICEDLKGVDVASKGGFTEIKKLINSDKIVDWAGWEKIDQFEVKQGKEKGKPREKITNVEKMLVVAKS